MAISVYDISELIRVDSDVTTSTTLAALKTHLQLGKTFTCPKCSGSGDITIVSAADGITYHVPCDVCNGFGKTVVEWEAYDLGNGYRLVTP